MNEALSATDLFKKRIVEGFSFRANELTAPNVLLALLLAFMVGFFIFYIYRKTFRGVMYSPNFGLSLILLSMITTLITMCIKSNLQLSLGMVGALSIVRFRTAIKDPMDTVYMFFSISIGIVLGAGYYLFAIVSAIFIGLTVLFLWFVPFKGINSYLLVLHYDDAAQAAVQVALKRLPYKKVKSKTVTRGGIEMTMEIRLPDERTEIVHSLLETPGVHDATLVSYQPDLL